ncbi:cupredoxin domain-containing protein [Effusibacillus consociatus]|uniref:Cupredoxin domain-containing protein n=1 Tax=Effusibacillus consociatus TaxID=1117041 RepID=A0ABV9PY08_9BACL
MKKKVLIPFAAALLSVGLLVGCSTSKPTASTNTQNSAPQTNSQTKEIVVTANNMSFEPKTVAVEKGTKVKLTLKNKEDKPNNLVVQGTNIKIDNVAPNQEQSVEFVADRQGEFNMVGTLSGMDSMSAKLIVK